MEVVLKKMGNSTALVMPPPVLKDLGIGVGQHLTMDTTADGKIVLTHDLDIYKNTEAPNDASHQINDLTLDQRPGS